MLYSMLHRTEFQNVRLQKIAAFIQSVSSYRHLFVLLFALGLVRNILLLLAYPPAHGADSSIYFLFAEHLTGLDLPLASNWAYPLYPLLIVASYKWLGSIYWLIGLQFIASATLAPLYYRLLKPYSPIVGLVSALVILGDVQLGLMFNFTSTEPLYITLMAVTLYLLIRLIETETPQSRYPLHALTGLMFALLLLTRSVARYLIVPMAIIMLMRTRDWRRVAVMLLGFGLTLGIFTLLINAGGQASTEAVETGDYIVGAILFNHPDWVKAENGPNSVTWLAMRQKCPVDRLFVNCAQTELGSWDALNALFSTTVRETIQANVGTYILVSFEKTMDFLSLPTYSYGIDGVLPSDVQCSGLDERLAAQSDEALSVDSRAWTLGLQTPDAMTSARPRIEAIYRAMCPPLPNVPALQPVVDFLSSRYRSLGRPQPYLWYGALAVLVLGVPWARRFLILSVVLGTVLLNHAIISGLISNVQPRYVVVVNPMRAILLVTLLYIVIRIAMSVLDWVLTGRKAVKSVTAESQAG